MSFYADWVLPRIIDLGLGLPVISEERRKTLAGVRGDVLELGFGTGLNLPHYPPEVRGLVAIDPATEGAKLARKRIAAAPFAVEYVPLEGEHIAAPSASFDSVVSTFTLCTIADPAAALAQVKRVLKPGGRLFLLEHGRSPELGVRRWQDRLNPVQRFACGGCNLNRDTEQLLREAGFAFEAIAKYYLPGQPKVIAFLTRGVARAA